ncbi:MAG: phosphotransferase [Promethearchaeota archaeon]
MDNNDLTSLQALPEVISAELLEKLKELYDIDKISLIEKLPSQISDVFYLEFFDKKGKREVIFKIYSMIINEADIRSEHLFLEHVSRKLHNISVPVPLKNHYGATFFSFNNRFFSIFRFLEGSLGEEKNDEIVLLGEALSEYHETVSGLEIDFDVERCAWLSPMKPIYFIKKMTAIEKSENIYSGYREMAGKAKEIYFNIADNLKNLHYDRLERIIIHGDFHARNLLFKRINSGKKITGILDFSNVRMGSRVEDIACAIVPYSFYGYKKTGNSFINLKKTLEPLKIFIRSYQKNVKLSEEEMDVIPDLMRKRTVDMATFILILSYSHDKKGESYTKIKNWLDFTDWIDYNKEKIVNYLKKRK